MFWWKGILFLWCRYYSLHGFINYCILHTFLYLNLFLKENFLLLCNSSLVISATCSNGVLSVSLCWYFTNIDKWQFEFLLIADPLTLRHHEVQNFFLSSRDKFTHVDSWNFYDKQNTYSIKSQKSNFTSIVPTLFWEKYCIQHFSFYETNVRIYHSVSNIDIYI